MGPSLALHLPSNRRGRSFLDARREYVNDVLSPQRLRDYGVFAPVVVQSLVKKAYSSSMTSTEARAVLIPEIRAFIIESFLFGQATSTLNDEDSFLSTGIIDSTGVLELVGFLEKHFGISIANEELVPDNLDSVSKCSSFVGRKLAQ
jgi:acyl carrier protein